MSDAIEPTDEMDALINRVWAECWKKHGGIKYRKFAYSLLGEIATRAATREPADRSKLLNAMLDWHAAVVRFGAESQTAFKHFETVAALSTQPGIAPPLDPPDASVHQTPQETVCERDDCWLHEKCFGHCHQAQAVAQRPKAADDDRADAERWRWFAGDCDGNAQDDLIRLLSGTILSKAEIDSLVDTARRERP